MNAAGWVNQLGRAVRVDHTASLESVYGHLSRIAPGVRAGATVERGQVIGFVGATGLATGPHLHFAVYRDGEYVDPLTLTAGTADPARRLDLQEKRDRECPAVTASTAWAPPW